MVDAENVFNPKDFDSLRLIVYFKNLTTRTDVRDKTKNALVEVGDKTLVLEVPAKCCNTKHSVMIDIKKFEKNSKKEKELLSVTGKVIEIEDVGEDVLRVTVECVQFEEKSWKELMSYYTNRQDEIEKFFTAVRGY